MSRRDTDAPSIPSAGRRTGAPGLDRLGLVLATALLVASLAHPSLPLERTAVDAVVAIDITQSMNVIDMPPPTGLDAPADGGAQARKVSRLAFARQALDDVLQRLPCGSRIGWAVFTEYRALLLIAPLEVCAHAGDLRRTLAGIDSRMAWAGNSEIAKGLHSAIGIATQLPGRPALVFLTDGQEAPPLNARFRPAFDDRPGDVRGLLVGLGGDAPLPIPKTDGEGRPLGTWQPDEVLQTDPRSRGRGASVAGEGLVDASLDAVPGPQPMLGATPGLEHLSGLREDYLRLLAGELGLAYARPRHATDLFEAMTTPALGRPAPGRLDLQPALAALALALLVLHFVRRSWPGALWRAGP